MSEEQKKPGKTAIHPRWFNLEKPEEMANEIIAISDGLEADDNARRNRYLTNLRLYELRPLKGLTAESYGNSAASEIILPVVRSVCDTVQADIAGRQRPVPMFMTSGADWKTRRRAKKLGKFVEAVLHQPQGAYVDGWELSVDVFLDACIYGTGAIHVYVDSKTDKVVLERVQPEEIHVDPREAECGEPLNYFRTYLYDADSLYYAFKNDKQFKESSEELKRTIEAAVTEEPKSEVKSYSLTRIGNAVKVREAIRLPLGDDEPGVHAFAIPQLLLKKEKWVRAEPYVFFRWSRERRGFWGISLVDEVRELADALNENFDRMLERMRLCANKRTVVSQDAGIDEAQLEANEAENIITCTGPAQNAIYESSTPAITQADIDWHQIVEGLCYRMPGVSQTSATARKEPGVDSGVAIRTMQDLATKRFAVKARYAFEYPFVALARKIVDAVSEYHKRTKKDITARLPQRRGIRDIKWSDVNLETELDVQVAPVSSLPSDPAGRLATVNELFMQQVISVETYKRLLAWPDLEQETSRDNAEWEYIEFVIEQFLDADEEAEDQELPSATPDSFIVHLEQALMQCTAAYFEAMRDGAPEANLELLRSYMTALGALIDQRMAAAMAAAAPPMPPGAPVPGAPAALPAPPAPIMPGGAPGAPGPIPLA